MNARREARELAMQALFQLDFNPQDLDAAVAAAWPDRELAADVKAFAEELIRGVAAHRAKIDEEVRRCSENWDLRRMGAVDRNILRVAMYELLFRPDIPPVVSIDEAIDIARDFSDETSAKFVNGILDRARQDLDRPARTGGKKAAKPEG